MVQLVTLSHAQSRVEVQGRNSKFLGLTLLYRRSSVLLEHGGLPHVPPLTRSKRVGVQGNLVTSPKSRALVFDFRILDLTKAWAGLGLGLVKFQRETLCPGM